MQIRTEQLEGRDHLVVPTVMLTVGVHNGSKGPLYYPADELARTAHQWNGRPVVVYHPKMAGDGYAGQPAVFNRQRVGTVFNARFVDGKLKADVWLDVLRLHAVDYRVLQTVQNGHMMEVSTGLYTDNDPTPGDYVMEPYTAIARNHKPDHLAILPDQVGACSIADGAGLCRNAGAMGLPLPSMC